MNWKAYIVPFLITIIFKYSRGSNGCTPFRAKNLGSLNPTLLNPLIDKIKDYIPVFDESTVPNFSSIMEEFNAGSSNEDIHLNITALLRKYGYGAEQHQVKTSDGYLLNIYHIPGKGPVVLVMHGILCSSDVFVCTGPDVGLAYLLADLGYDVWLGNVRGNPYGRKHITLSPDCAEFWQFTWDEMGRYDLPATIDYILKETKQEKLAYIAHSQGTTIFFVMASELPEYNDKISVMIALSAVSYLSHTKSLLLSTLSRLSDLGDFLAQAIGLYEFTPRNQFLDAITTIACSTPWTASVFCDSFVFLFTGFDFLGANATILPAVYGHFPEGGSTKQLIHFGQLIVSGTFRKFDYGTLENLAKYGSATPPDYPLEKVTSKVAIFYADNDNYFSAAEDRAKLVARLPNIIEQYRVPYTAFAHLDFLFGKNLKELVYDKVKDVLSKNV
ncbi:lipase 3-like [Plodia interpunctella]|uniref:lipase 3-like n=1 Tax=Plodia interpunctella TaxID=58824 RepID=UPI002367B39C|nr:lipase 3-like [Plodia interpunctella]